VETLFKENQLEESEKYAAINFQCSPAGSSKTPTLITGKDAQPGPNKLAFLRIAGIIG